MARETKAERDARIARETAETIAMQEKEYPTKLMDILERVNKLSDEYSVNIVNRQFVIRSHRYETDSYLTLGFSIESQNSLESLEWDVKLREEDAREEERLRLLRANALNKLSSEEKEVLGIAGSWNR